MLLDVTEDGLCVGLVPLTTIFEAIEDSRTLYTDTLLELLGNEIILFDIVC